MNDFTPTATNLDCGSSTISGEPDSPEVGQNSFCRNKFIDFEVFYIKCDWTVVTYVELGGADSAGRVVGVGGMLQKTPSKELRQRISALDDVHGVVPLPEELSVLRQVVGYKVDYKVQWRRFGPS